MTNEEAKKMLKAKLDCLIRETSGTDVDCNHKNCDECNLCYEQGNMGEQKEALELAIKALEQEPDTWSLEDAREDFVDDVYNTLDFLPTNEEANMIIDSFNRVTSGIRQEPCEDCISREAALEQAMDYGSKTFLIPANSIKALPPVIPKFTDEEIDRTQAVEQPCEDCTVIKKLSKKYYVEDAYGYTDEDIVNKVNEIIDVVNELLSVMPKAESEDGECR